LIGARSTIRKASDISFTSSPVITATTPRIPAAFEVSMETISAWACGERRIAACRVPGRIGRWSEYCALPMRRISSSTRSMGRPT